MTHRPAPILASYHYFKRSDISAAVGGPEHVDLFADSGAFSAHNSGAAVSLPDYVAWLRDHARVINFAAALDVIGDPVASRRNADTMRDALGAAVTVVPTFHVGSPWPALEDMLRSYRFIAIGGAVAHNQNEAGLMPFLVKAHRILRDHGAVAHGFGLTKPPYPSSLPWYSVDSSYWTSAGRTGSISLWDGRQFAKCRMGTPGAVKHAAVIRSYGGDPVRGSKPGFGLVREQGDQGRVDRMWMDDVSALSYWRYGDWIAARRHVPAPPGVRGDGPKLYLAAGSTRTLEQLRRVWISHTRDAHPPRSTA
jgi:hypothetical protein